MINTEILHIDGSNGIGAPKAQILAKHLEGVHEFEIRNVSGKLNYQVVLYLFIYQNVRLELTL